MASDGLVELYDKDDYLSGEIIAVSARWLKYEQMELGEHTTAEPCCRVTAISRNSNSEAVVTKPARVNHKGHAKGGLAPMDLRQMMGKILIGEILGIEGVKHGKEKTVHKTGAHRGFRNEVMGNDDHLVFAVVDEPAKVYYLKKKREEGRSTHQSH